MPQRPLDGGEHSSAENNSKPLESKPFSLDDDFRSELYEQFGNFADSFKIENFSPQADQNNESANEDGVLEMNSPFTVEKAAGDVVKNAKDVDDKGQEADKPVKLDKLKFDESEVKEALELAKKHDLPVAVYTGATWCPSCPSASEKFNDIAHDMEKASETPAVMIKLDADKANALAGNNTEEGKALKEFMGDANRIPNVAIYNPNDVSTPVSDATVPGWGKQSIKSHMDKAFKQVRKDLGKEATDGGAKVEETIETDFNESNYKDAIQKAKDANLPLLTYVDNGDGSAAKMGNALKYLSEKNLAVSAVVSPEKVDKMFQAGLESKHYNALKSAVSGNASSDGSTLSSAKPESIPANLRFSQNRNENPQSVEDTIQFLKDSGVDLSEPNNEAAVKALLEGKPIPEAVDEKVEGKFESNHKVSNVEEAKKVMELAKEKNLPLVAHAKTVICSGNSCTMKELSPSSINDLKDKAIFMEVPRGGFSDADVQGNKDLETINELFKVSEDDKKTEIDINVFKFDQSKENKMEKQTTNLEQNFSINRYLSDLIDN